MLQPLLKRPAALLAALFAALALHAAAPVRAEAGRPHLSSDPQVVRARALVERGRYAEALEILRRLAPEDRPDGTDIRFLTGVAAIEAARRIEARRADAGAGDTDGAGRRDALLDEAVAALRAILVRRPELARVRLELARAFFLKREDGLARRHFERVLAGRLPAAMAANIRRFLRIARERRRWSGYFGAAVAPDSNVNAASDADAFHIGPLRFRRDADAGPRSGTGVIVWGGGEYRHPLGGALWLRAGADFARREYAGGMFDRTYLAGHAGPQWRIGGGAEASLLASARRRWAAGAPESYSLGVRLEAGRRLLRPLTASVQASWHRRFHDRNGAALDGPVLDAVVGARWFPSPTVRVDLALAYGIERPRAKVWRNAGPRVRAGVAVALPFGFTAGAGAALRWTRYRGGWAPFVRNGSPRRDRVRTLQVSLLNRAFTVQGLSPQLVLAHEVRESNAQLYGYQRSRAELRFVRQF